MKDIGYYAGFLTSEDRSKIENASRWQLADVLNDISFSLYDLYSNDETAEKVEDTIRIDWVNRSDRDKLALIRGLCNRIELKLMEQAS